MYKKWASYINTKLKLDLLQLHLNLVNKSINERKITHKKKSIY